VRTSLAVWQRELHPLRAVMPHDRIILSIALSPNGKILATGYDDGTARLWDAATGLQVGPGMEHQRGGYVAVSFSPNGKVLATRGGEDGIVRLWQTGTGKRLPFELKHNDAINIVAFTPDSQTILTISKAAAQLWEISTGKRLSPSMPMPDEVHDAVFYADGRTFLTASREGAVRQWEVATRKQLAEMFKLPRGVSALAIS